MWVYGLDWAGSGYRQLADACECGNEHSGSVKCGEFLDCPSYRKPFLYPQPEDAPCRVDRDPLHGFNDFSKHNI